MKREIKVIFNDYEKDYFILFESKGIDIGIEFALCEFVDEMNHWHLPVRIEERNGRIGYSISNDIPKEIIEAEILRFIKHNGLDEDL